jgi:hypothetical protein
MSTSALLASLAILYGIAHADPAVLTMTGADPIGAATPPASVAAGLNSISVTLSGADKVTVKTKHGGAGITRRTAVTTAEASTADLPFDMIVAAAPNGLDHFNPDINRTGAPASGAAGSQPLFAGLSFSFGAELYTQQPDPVSAVPEPPTRATIMGFVGLGFLPYLVARAMLAQPDRFAFTDRSK